MNNLLTKHDIPSYEQMCKLSAKMLEIYNKKYPKENNNK